MRGKSNQEKQIDLGTLSLTIKKLSFGKGPKSVGLVFGIHGVETAGLFLLKTLWERRGELRNRVVAIPSANPSGLIMSSRFGNLDIPADFKDPNRTFPGKSGGSVQERVNAALMSLLEDCDFVIDIHNYSNLGSFFPIFSLEGVGENQEGKKLTKKIEDFLKELEMGCAYFVSGEEANKRGFAGTLTEALHQKGIPSLSLEGPPIEFLSEDDLEKVTSQLIKAINRFGKEERSRAPMPVLLTTKIFKSERAGVFTPAVKPPAKIKKGEEVGKIFDPFLEEEISILTPSNGVLLICKRKDFVRVGEFLFEIGRPIKKPFSGR